MLKSKIENAATPKQDMVDIYASLTSYFFFSIVFPGHVMVFYKYEWCVASPVQAMLWLLGSKYILLHFFTYSTLYKIFTKST